MHVRRAVYSDLSMMGPPLTWCVFISLSSPTHTGAIKHFVARSILQGRNRVEVNEPTCSSCCGSQTVILSAVPRATLVPSVLVLHGTDHCWAHSCLLQKSSIALFTLVPPPAFCHLPSISGNWVLKTEECSAHSDTLSNQQSHSLVCQSMRNVLGIQNPYCQQQLRLSEMFLVKHQSKHHCMYLLVYPS